LTRFALTRLEGESARNDANARTEEEGRIRFQARELQLQEEGVPGVLLTGETDPFAVESRRDRLNILINHLPSDVGFLESVEVMRIASFGAN